MRYMKDWIDQAVALDIPVLGGVVDRKHVRVWCDGCFTWHWHGGPGMKGAHCPQAPGWYVVIPTRLDPALTFAHKVNTQWRVACPRKTCATHLRPTTGQLSKPHYMIVAPRPGPGSPSFCVVTGRFFDLTTGKQVDPGYTDDQMIRWRYWLDDDALRSRGIAHREIG